MPRPPLAYMGGALAINAFSPPLQIHNAARMIVGVALALVLLATAHASRELNGRAFRWLPVLMLVGSVGILGPRARVVARALHDARRRDRRCGVSRSRCGDPSPGGALLGAGIAWHFWATGFSGRSGSSLTALVLPAVRNRVAQPRVPRHRGRGARAWGSPARAAVAAGAARARPGAVRRVARERDRRATTSAFLGDGMRAADPCTTCAISRGSRGRRCRWCCGCCGCAGADSTAACARRAWWCRA